MGPDYPPGCGPVQERDRKCPVDLGWVDTHKEDMDIPVGRPEADQTRFAPEGAAKVAPSHSRGVELGVEGKDHSLDLDTELGLEKRNVLVAMARLIHRSKAERKVPHLSAERDWHQALDHSPCSGFPARR